MIQAGAKTVGTGFLNIKKYADDRLPPGTWEKTLASMSEEDRLVIKSAIAIGWYDLQLFLRLIIAIDALAGTGDYEVGAAIGRYSAENDVGGFLRFVLRLANPAFVVERGVKIWNRFQDSGSPVFERLASNHVRWVLTDWGVAHPATCINLGGYLKRLAELVGARNVVYRHAECCASGAAHCIFEFSWE